MQSLLAAASQVTTVPGLVLQVPPWQDGEPLHKLLSSWHWLSFWQKQLLNTPAHLPP